MKRLNAEHLATVSAAEEADRKKLKEIREGETEAEDAADDPMAVVEAEALKAT